MSYTALYRKFRPQEFEDVKGQEHIVTTLKNQIKADRIGHAYLFCGTRGTGKTTVAKIFARAVNCEHPIDGSPCGECPSCKAIKEGTSMNVIEIDAASNNGVDNIREIREEVAYSPTEGKYKVYIIDEVHMLSIGAFNALLKTLEEPPSYVIFILATTEANKIPITILSRCQRYDFRRITIDTIAARLTELLEAEGVEAEEKAVRYVAKAGDGSLRDAISLLDRCIAFYLGEKLTYDKVLDVLGAVDTEVFSRMLRLILKQDIPGLMALLEELILKGREPGQLVVDFTWYLRNLLLLKSSGDMEDVLDISSENLVLLKEEAQLVEAEELMRYIRVFSELNNRIRYAAQKRILIEMALIKLCRPQMEENLEALLARVSQLEKKIEQGIPAAAFSGAGGPPLGAAPYGGENGVGYGPGAGTGAGGPFPGGGQFPGTAGALGPFPGAETSGLGSPVLPKAVPEDVRQAVQNWRGIVQSLSGLMRAYLSPDKVCVSLGGDGSLLLVFEDEMAESYLNTPEHKAELTRVVSNRIGKEIQIQIKRNDTGRPVRDVYPDLEKLNIEIEIEED